MEFAVTSSVAFLAIIGFMKMSLAIYTFHFVSEAAREGTRYAIVRGSSCTTFTTACPAATDGSDVQTYVRALAYPGITGSAMTVTSTYASYPSGVCTPSLNCNNPGNLVTVKVQYAFPLSIPLMANKTLTMTSTSAMVISQ